LHDENHSRGHFLGGFRIAPLCTRRRGSRSRAAAGCGPDQIKFEVKTDKNQHPAPKAEPTKALVYVFQDVKQDNTLTIGAATTRVGLDGAWIGQSTASHIFSFQRSRGIIACVQPAIQPQENLQTGFGRRSKC